MEPTIEILKIKTTDIIFQDFEYGRGKIIISDSSYGYNFSYFWGSMGSTLKEFLLSINSGYFVNKLSTRHQGGVCLKRTMRTIKKFIKVDIGLQWYEHMEFQKDMREKINEFIDEYSDEISPDYFGYKLEELVKSFDYDLIERGYTRDSIERDFKNIWSGEWWHFLEYTTPQENIWLEKLHGKLKKVISKELKVVSKTA